MAGREVLIDGYNVIRADRALSDVEVRSLEEARAALIKAVAASPRFLGDAVTIVFDGGGLRSFGTVERFGHVTVQFPPPGSTADDLIKARAKASDSPGNVIVVTNDVDIRLFCGGIGCTVTGSQNLLSQLATPRKLHRPRFDGDGDEYVPSASGGRTKGNPRRLPKRMRNQREYRF